MKVTEFNRLESSEFLQMLKRTKQWIGIRGVSLLRKYLNSATDTEREAMLSKVSILMCRYSMVMTIRLTMLDISQQYKHQISKFIPTPAEKKYIERQLLRFIGLSKSTENKMNNDQNIQLTMDIDRKYKINAVNPCSGNEHTEKDAVLFLAKDRAFLEGALPGYRAKCIELGAGPAHIESIDLLINRVKTFQELVENKVPDTDLPCEVRRCVDGEGVAK